MIIRRTATISDHPMAVGEMLRRADAREERRARSILRRIWRRVRGVPEVECRVARFGPHEVCFSPRKVVRR